MNFSSSSREKSPQPFAEVSAMPPDKERGHYCQPDNHKSVPWVSAERKPPVDIFENQREYVITVELPGISEDDLKVVYQNSELHIIADDSEMASEPPLSFIRQERSRGTCHRIFTIPRDALVKYRREELKRGLLRIVLPKSPSAVASSTSNSRQRHGRSPTVSERPSLGRNVLDAMENQSGAPTMSS